MKAGLRMGATVMSKHEEQGDVLQVARDGPVAIVTFDRGERRNALSLAAMRALTRAAEDFRDDTKSIAVVLTGSSREFSAGVDLKDPARWDIDQLSMAERRTVASWGGRMCKAWEEMPQLTIAAIEGFNVGGGVALTLACDWRVMAEGAYLLVPEAQIGLPLGWQAVPRLVNAVGAAKAKQIILLGARMSADEALSAGLADWIAPDGDAAAHAAEIASKVAKNPGAVVRMTKQHINAYANALNHVSSFMDVDQALLCNQSREAIEARAAFRTSKKDAGSS
jgi:enoyl-CoA hydratase